MIHSAPMREAVGAIHLRKDMKQAHAADCIQLMRHAHDAWAGASNDRTRGVLPRNLAGISERS